mmetsp:Transcript_31224/g.46166  ORF Transcript_31224/g.46166 Transcript_31224/m.46166 type:complete len:442 (-) Transcript_31224:3-1328(-)
MAAISSLAKLFLLGCLVILVKSLNSHLASRRQLLLRPYPCFAFNTGLRAAAENKQGYDDEDRNQGLRLDLRNELKSLTNEANSRLKGIAERVNPDVISSTKNATSRVRELAERGGVGVSFIAGEATSRVRELAEKSGSGVSSVAGTATSQVRELAEKGGAGVRSVAGATTSRVKELTEKSGSDIASIAEWVDMQAKSGVDTAKSQSKALVLKFTGKEEYQFGDITKELVRRIVAEEYNLADILLLCKLLLAIGASFSPLAQVLPVKVLLDMLNFSLEQKIGGKILEVVAGSLDERFTAAFTGDDKFQLGDLTKRTLTSSLSNFTGKDSYESGDVKRAVTECVVEDDNPKENANAKENFTPTTLDFRVGPEFEEWDVAFREKYPDVSLTIAKCLDEEEDDGQLSSGRIKMTSAKALDLEIATELEEWDRMFKSKYPDTADDL